MQLYSISDRYIEYLRKTFPRVYSNKEDNRVHTRKYLGAVLSIDNFKYFIPLSSPKDKHDYIMVNNKKEIRKDSIIVIRMTFGMINKVLKGTLQIGTMIPVPDSEITLYDIKNEKDVKYKELVNDEMIFIRKNTERIIKTAKLLYSKKANDDGKNKVIANILNFKEIEIKCLEWEKFNLLKNV